MTRAAYNATGAKLKGDGAPTIMSFLAHFQKVVAAAGTVVKAAQALATGATSTVTTGFTQPDVARNVSLVANQAGCVGNVVFTFLDDAGKTDTETLVANGTTPVVGLKAMKTIVQVVFPQRTTAGDTITISTGSKLGLSHKLKHNTVGKANTFLNNVVEATDPTVACGPTNLASNTILLNSALNGTVVDCYYMTTS